MLNCLIKSSFSLDFAVLISYVIFLDFKLEIEFNICPFVPADQHGLIKYELQ